jgi:hypothetical protein
MTAAILAGMTHWAAALWMIVLASGCTSQPPRSSLEVGLATRDITPPVGYRMAGYFYERRSTAVHDPLHAKAIVFRQGDTRFAWVVCDLCQTSPEVVERARAEASRETGIPPDYICVTSTHTHTGPDYFGPLAEHLRSLAMAANNGVDPATTVDYPALLAGRIVEAIVEANASLAPAEIRVTSAHQEGLAFNRRYVMSDGTVAWNPGKKNPKIVRPAGPIDPQIQYLWVTRPASTQPAAVVTNFALHPDTVSGTQFSADYAYYLERGLREALGPAVTSIFAQGTCGNINHVDVSTDRKQGGFDEAERIGSALAGGARLASATTRPAARGTLAVASTRVELPLQQYTPEEVADARSLFAKIQERKLPFLVGVKAAKIVRIYDRHGGRPISARVQAARVGDDTAVVFLPSEVFVEFGLEIKRRSPFANTLVVELANESFGYIPTRKAFDEGAYEPTNSTISPGGGERLTEAAVHLLEQLKP